MVIAEINDAERFKCDSHAARSFSATEFTLWHKRHVILAERLGRAARSERRVTSVRVAWHGWGLEHSTPAIRLVLEQSGDHIFN
jgi:hypothetical protein